MPKSTAKRTSRKVLKPPKPYADFPLTPHNGGSWMKKIRNPITGKSKIHYFGKWGRVVNGVVQQLPGDGWQDAERLCNAQREDLHAGRTPKVQSLADLNPDGTVKVKEPAGLTLKDLCNRFLTAKSRKKSSGELSALSFQELKRTTDQLVEQFGKDRLVDDLVASDFEILRAEIAKKWGPVRLGNEVTRVRSVFKFAYDNGLIDRPVRFGGEFTKPSRSVLRKHKAASGPKLLEAREIKKLIDAADPMMKAVILLGINAAYGNSDCANLEQSMIDGSWANFPRPKTGIDRRCPLWTETTEAIQAAIAERPKPADEADGNCVFLTAQGKRLVRATKDAKTDAVSVKFRKLAKAAGVHRPGIGFYSLRHVFQSVADGARDPVAVKMIMGHADASMSGHYREFVADENLVAVTEHVHGWLFGKGGAK